MEKSTANKKIMIVGIVLICACLVLTLVSKTIYIYRLPVVTAAMPFTGALSKTEKTTGLARWSQISDIYADTGGKVEALYVKEGQKVETGDALFSLSFDEDEIRQSLKEIQVQRSQKQTEINSSQLQIESHNSEVKRAEKVAEDLRVLYEAGAVSKNEYDNAQSDLQSLRDQNKMLRNQITQLELDLKAYDIQQETHQSKLGDFAKNTTIYAPESGEIMDLFVTEGQQIPDGFQAGRIGCGETHEITCMLSLENNFVTLGDSCKLKNTNHSFVGIVTKITLTDSGKIVTVALASSEISTGETFQVAFEKDSAESYTLVPNAALNMDNDGYFLYQVKQSAGVLGEEYYVQKLRVYTGDNDDSNTVITKGLSFYEPIALHSSKPISEGKRIRLSNVGDFFE